MRLVAYHHRPLCRPLAASAILIVSCARQTMGFAAHSSSSTAVSASGWSPADDWARLSSESRMIDTAALLGADLTGEAARKMEEEAEAAAADLAVANADGSPDEASVPPIPASPEDYLIAEAIETIQNSIDPSDPPLYDSPSSFADYQKSDDAAERAAAEIGMLIRSMQRQCRGRSASAPTKLRKGGD